jgi:hypothetical protein
MLRASSLPRAADWIADSASATVIGGLGTLVQAVSILTDSRSSVPRRPDSNCAFSVAPTSPGSAPLPRSGVFESCRRSRRSSSRNSPDFA